MPPRRALRLVLSAGVLPRTSVHEHTREHDDGAVHGHGDQHVGVHAHDHNDDGGDVDSKEDPATVVPETPDEQFRDGIGVTGLVDVVFANGEYPDLWSIDDTPVARGGCEFAFSAKFSGTLFDFSGDVTCEGFGSYVYTNHGEC